MDGDGAAGNDDPGLRGGPTVGGAQGHNIARRLHLRGSQHCREPVGLQMGLWHVGIGRGGGPVELPVGVTRDAGVAAGVPEPALEQEVFRGGMRLRHGVDLHINVGGGACSWRGGRGSGGGGCSGGRGAGGCCRGAGASASGGR